MKINIAFLILFWSMSFVLASGLVKGQDVLKKKVTISFENVYISKALDKITDASGVKFTYNGAIASSKIKVSVSAANQELGRLLNDMLKNTPFTFEVLDDEIFIKPVNNKKKDRTGQRILTGRVTDEKGLPMPGVTVKVKDTERGTVTDLNGQYQIQINDDSETLVFDFIGYKTMEEITGNTTALDIQLMPLPANELKEVAVVAYGTQRKISLVGAQSAVNIDELKDIPVASLSTLLAGRVAGIIGVQRTGEPGIDGSNIWIRGHADFNTSLPLILIDGVERYNIDNLEPLDIQSFTILKDASATAVYGVKGANGVILIQTKKGTAGKPKINIDYYEGTQTFTRIPNMADGATYMAAANEANTTRGQNPIYSQTYIQNTINKTDPLVYPDVDWMKAVFRNNAPTRRLHLSVSGGSLGATYYVATGYEYTGGLLKATTNDEGDDINDDYGRYNFLTNINLQATKTTKIEIGAQGFIYKSANPGVASSFIFTDAVSVPPVAFPTIYPGGFVPGTNANGSQPDPYADLTTRGYTRTFTYQLYSNIRLTQDLGFVIPGLNFTVMYAFDNGGSTYLQALKKESSYFVDSNTPYHADGSLNLDLTDDTGTQNTLSFSNNGGGYYQSYTESSFNYDHTTGKSRIGGLALFTQDDLSDYVVNSVTEFIPYRHRGLAVRATYSYANKYFAEYNAGYNGSENFAPQNRYGYFPAYGIGWLLSSENFFEPFKHAISFLKLRYTNGYVGISDNGFRFGYLTFVSNNHPGYTYGTGRDNISGIGIDQYGVDVTWSKSHKQDLGMDLKILNDHLSLTADIFTEHRTGILISRNNVPGFVGISNLPLVNAGIVDNKGFDATLDDRLSFGKFNLSLSANVTYSSNKVVQNDQPVPPYPWMSQIGRNASSQFGFVADGLFTSQAEIDKSAVPGDKSLVMPGDIKYKDLNGDGVINAYDQTVIGNGDVPKLIYGFTFNASYKNFDLGAAFEGTGRADRYISGIGIQPFSANAGLTNTFSNITDRWTLQNPVQNVFYPRLAYGEAANFNNTQTSSWWIKNTAFFRLKTMNFGYTFPKSLTSKYGIKSFRIYLMAYNLFTISKFKLWDPELDTGNGTVYPNVKTISAGLSAGFN